MMKSFFVQEPVLAALRKGDKTRKELCEETGLSDRQVHGALVGLAGKEAVCLRHGKWRSLK